MDIQESIAQMALAKRILVLGSSGSGKTTFSIQLGRILNLKTIHLDAQFWKPGRIATPQPEWREIVASLIQAESWIMDGTYESTLDLRIPAADTVVVIGSSRWTCLWRMLKRQAFSKSDGRPDAPKGPIPDSVASQRRALLPHYASWLRYIWQYPTVTQPFVLDCIQKYGPDKTLIQLGTPNDIQRCLGQIQPTDCPTMQ